MSEAFEAVIGGILVLIGMVMITFWWSESWDLVYFGFGLALVAIGFVSGLQSQQNGKTIVVINDNE